MRGERHADQYRNRKQCDGAEQGADGECRRKEQCHEGKIDRERRHLAGEESAQHVELAQSLGNDTRGCALEMPVGELHQVMHDFAAHHGVQARTGLGRQPAAAHAERKVENVGRQHGGAEFRHQQGDRIGATASGQAVQHEHHEERRGEAQQVDRKRCRGKSQDDRPHFGGKRYVPVDALAGHGRQAQHERACAQGSHALDGRLPDAAFDHVEHGPLVAASGHDDMGGTRGGDDGEGGRQLVERGRPKIQGAGLKTQADADTEEARLVERIFGQGREPTHIGFADGPADLLGDVEKRPHQGVDGTSRRA